MLGLPEVFVNRVPNLYGFGTQQTSVGTACCVRVWKVSTTISQTSTASTTTSPEAHALRDFMLRFA